MNSLSFAMADGRRKAVWGPRRLVVVALLAVLAALILGPTVSAQGPATAARIVNTPVTGTPVTADPLDQSAGAFRARRTADRRIIINGIVRTSAGLLVPKAGVIIIRRLEDGRSVAQMPVDEFAQFTWRDLEAGVYVAELIDRSGRVIATTSAFTAASGDVIQLTPIIPTTPDSGFASWLSTATDAVINSAAGAGILAVSTGLPVSPR